MIKRAICVTCIIGAVMTLFPSRADAWGGMYSGYGSGGSNSSGYGSSYTPPSSYNYGGYRSGFGYNERYPAGVYSGWF